MQNKTSILIIYTGGTIGMIHDPKTGILKTLAFDNIYRYLPVLENFNYNFDFYTFHPLLDSSNMHPSFWVELATLIEKNYELFDVMGQIIWKGMHIEQQNFSAFGLPSSTQYKETSTGFSVTPRLVGQQVLLNVSPWSETMNGKGQVGVHQAQSTLRINLGEWVEIGGIGQNPNANMNGTLMTTRQIDKNTLHILIKVDQVD